VRVDDTRARWILCFVALPALWAVASLGTHLQAVSMIPAAFVAALLSASTAYRSGRGKHGALGYFLGTGAMLGVAFAITVIAILSVYCGDSIDGDC
jgi:hypothetical protein